LSVENELLDAAEQIARGADGNVHDGLTSALVCTGGRALLGPARPISVAPSAPPYTST
jgi:hypothetical protein